MSTHYTDLPEVLNLDDPLDARLYASQHSPVLRRWAEYPAALRDAWRLYFGFGWVEHLMLPPALDPLTPELEPAPAPKDGEGPPVANTRPPDLPPMPQLPPAGAAGRPRLTARERPAPAGGLPF